MAKATIHYTMANKAARERWGDAWALLSDEQRAGAVALAYVKIVAGQEADEESHAGRIIETASMIVETWA